MISANRHIERHLQLRIAGILFLAGVAGFLLSACDESPGTVDAGMKVPGVGSTFSTHVVQGRNGETPVEGNFEVTVRATDMIVDGRERVAQFASDTATSLVCYEPNGDISFYMKKGTIAGCEVDNTWLRFPLGGSGGISEALPVMRRDATGAATQCLASWQASPAGEEEITVGTETVRAQKSIAQFQFGSDSPDDTITRSRRYTVWYAPELGYVVREEILSLQGVREPFDTIGFSRRELTRYSLSR